MPRRRSNIALAAVATCALAGCQDYNFNPVGKCVIQPGSTRISLANTAVADVLFVVDDSGSMNPEQANLARNFTAFIDTLAQAQAARIANAQQPFEFHIAVTTSSIFEGWVPNDSPIPACSGTPGHFQCNIQHPHWGGLSYTAACTDAEAGLACNDLNEVFQGPVTGFACTAGVSQLHGAYPAGDFVGAQGNPRVLHFTKNLQWSTWGTGSPDSNLTALVQQFQQNINVGSCGSGMEQHFEAGRLALQKALRQNGLSQPTGIDPTEWPHPGAKLVVVWVGDEDDCSSPSDPTKSLAFTNATSSPGADVCIAEQAKPLASQKLFPVQGYADYFTSLSRPFGAAFIYSAQLGTCVDDGNGNIKCTPGTCQCQCPSSCTSGCSSSATGVCNTSNCGGQISLPSSRFSQLSTLLRTPVAEGGKGVNVIEGSVCDSDFASTLQKIANLVKPVDNLALPSQPANTDVAVLRIDNADGTTAKFCTGPGSARPDWVFVDCRTNVPAPSGTTTACIKLDHTTGNCEASPGQSYVAQYLGQVPQGGCTKPVGELDAQSQFCATALGGAPDAWRCNGFVAASGSNPARAGTCVCNPGST
jgi:hypothetical protein